MPDPASKEEFTPRKVGKRSSGHPIRENSRGEKGEEEFSGRCIFSYPLRPACAPLLVAAADDAVAAGNNKFHARFYRSTLRRPI